MSQFFSSRQIGQLVGADPSSVNRWIDSGKLNAYRTPGGHRRVAREDLISFLESWDMPMPDELRDMKRNVLLVDDDTLVLRSIKKSLSKIDPSLEIRSCTSGIQALILIGASRPDVVVLDIYMPGLDGIEVCHQIHSNPETRGIKIIAMTGNGSPAIEKRVRDAGASGFIVKPFKATQLVAEIRGAAQIHARG